MTTALEGFELSVPKPVLKLSELKRKTLTYPNQQSFLFLFFGVDIHSALSHTMTNSADQPTQESLR